MQIIGVFVFYFCLYGSFTRTVNITVFVSGAFDHFNIMGEQDHRTALNLFLNGAKKLLS